MNRDVLIKMKNAAFIIKVVKGESVSKLTTTMRFCGCF